MKANPSLDEIETLLDAGTLPAARIRWIVATIMCIPIERVGIQIVDVGIRGKLGVLATFDPELTREEVRLYELAMEALAVVLGTQPPIRMASA